MFRYVVLVLVISALCGCTGLKKMSMLMGSNPEAKNPAVVSLGEIVYRSQCLQCHGNEMNGKGPLAAGIVTPVADLRSLAASKSVNSFAANTMYGKGADMPAFQGIISEREVWYVANYLKSLAEGKK